MFKKLFGSAGSKPAAAPVASSSANTTIDAITANLQQEETLIKRQELLEKKVQQELEKGKELLKANKKNQALLCMRRKKQYEDEIVRIGNLILKLSEQRGMLEAQQTNVLAINALDQGQKVISAGLKNTKVEKIDKLVDDMAEAKAQMDEFNQALAQPTGVEEDEDELLKELEDGIAQDLDAQLTEPAAVPTHAVPAQAGKLPAVPTRPVPAKPAMTKEEEELAQLEKEFA